MYDIYKYIHHLRACPFEFRGLSMHHAESGIDTNALILDVLRDIDPSFQIDSEIKTAKELAACKQEHLIAVHIGCWFFSLDKFQNIPLLSKPILQFLMEELRLLSDFVKGNEWLEDDERSEEFVRGALVLCNILPEGETEIEANDQFEAVSTLKRNNVLGKSKAAFDRIMEIRRQMAEAKAREAANPYGRE